MKTLEQFPKFSATYSFEIFPKFFFRLTDIVTVISKILNMKNDQIIWLGKKHKNNKEKKQYKNNTAKQK